ncbi:MAG: diphthine--ammonia ligase [Candidatus Bathyarchaeum tardum]|nr:MAG: diphthine--ammonia ligase [Candidatus Bathyarchaeum tardum]
MKVAVSWSGGLESSLALHKVIEEGHDVICLVTFVLGKYWPAMGHPPKIMKRQTESIGIPHLLVNVDEPFKEGYHNAIAELIKTQGIEGIVTGDIYVVDETHGNWMEDVTEGLDIKVIVPLWEQDTFEVLDDEMSSGFRAVFTCVKQPFFTKEWIGKELNRHTVKDLLVLVKETGMDPCGENGEYHTMVIDGPLFKKPISIPEFTREQAQERFFMKIKE